MFLVDFEMSGLAVLKELSDDLKSMKKTLKKSISNKLVNLPDSQYKKVVFSSNIRNLTQASSRQKETPLGSSDKVKDVVITRGDSRYLRTFRGGRRDTVASIKRAFASANNGILLIFPDIDASKGAVFKPRASDLEVKRDGRGANLWGIRLKETAIKRITKSLETHLHTIVSAEIDRTLLGTAGVSGITVNIAARLGVQAESIEMVNTDHTGEDITREVQAEVLSRMGKGQSDIKLNSRTGRFVSSIDRVIVQKNKLITYSFDKRHYGIQEKTDASGNPVTTIIRPTKGPYLRFKNLKTNRWLAVKSVKVRSRPVIQKSIRSVAYKKFKQRFKMAVR